MIFMYVVAVFEGLITLMMLVGKSIAGYLLIVYYALEAGIDYLIYKTGRGKNTQNIYFKW